MKKSELEQRLVTLKSKRAEQAGFIQRMNSEFEKAKKQGRKARAIMLNEIMEAETQDLRISIIRVEKSLGQLKKFE